MKNPFRNFNSSPEVIRRAAERNSPPLPAAAVTAAPLTGKHLRKLGGERQMATWQGMTPAQIEGKSIYNDVGAFLGKVEDVLGDDEFQIAAITGLGKSDLEGMEPWHGE